MTPRTSPKGYDETIIIGKISIKRTVPVCEDSLRMKIISTCIPMVGRSPMLDMNVTRQVLDPTIDASPSLEISKGDATFGSADNADAMREAGALCGIGTVAAPSRERRKVPDKASDMLISCCS